MSGITYCYLISGALCVHDLDLQQRGHDIKSRFYEVVASKLKSLHCDQLKAIQSTNHML